MQDEKWALGKSKNWDDLTKHTTVYSLLWLVPSSIMLNDFRLAVLFVLITFIFHTVTDYITSRIVSKRFEKERIIAVNINDDYYTPGDILINGSNKTEYIIMNNHFEDKYTYNIKRYNSIPNFGAFTIIGLDQCLHMIQLFTTYYFLMK